MLLKHIFMVLSYVQQCMCIWKGFVKNNSGTHCVPLRENKMAYLYCMEDDDEIGKSDRDRIPKGVWTSGGCHLHDMTITLTWPFDRCSYLSILPSCPPLHIQILLHVCLCWCWVDGEQTGRMGWVQTGKDVWCTGTHAHSHTHVMLFFGSNAMAEQREIFMRWPTWPTRTPLPFPMQPPAVLESQKFRIQIQFEIKARPRKKFPEGVESPNCKRSHCCLWWKMSKITLPASVHWKNSYIFKDIPDYNSWLNTDINQLTYNKNMLEK